VTLVLSVGAVIFGLMIAEARVSRVHERALRARGAVAPSGDVYTALSITYPAAFLAMTLEGAWRASQTPAATAGAPNWFLSGVLLFVAGKGLKYWAIRSLGERWTFKVFVLPGLPLVTTGPYRYIEHPNYLGLAGELVGAAMMCGAPVAGALGSLAFGLVLWMRVRFEAGVLRQVREESGR